MIVSIVNQKGGTGKTTTALNLGRALSKLGHKVLLIDMDPQGSLSFSLGVMNPEFTTSDFMTDSSGHSAIHDIESENIMLIPASIELANVELNLSKAENRAFHLKDSLNDIKSEFDFIVIDCPPSLSLLTINALSASDTVVIPFQLEVLSIRGLDQIITSISKIKNSYNENLSIAGLLPVMTDSRKKLTHEVYEYVKKNYEIPIFDSFIRVNVRLSEAPSFAQSIFTYAPESNGANDYALLASELTKTKH